MLRQSRYYVRREQCWGETFVWVIADRERRITYQAGCVGKPYKTERAAKSMCEKANKDWERFLFLIGSVMALSPGTGGPGTKVSE